MQHSDLVIQPFGDQAQAYLHSDVHARGAELQVLADLVRALAIQQYQNQ